METSRSSEGPATEIPQTYEETENYSYCALPAVPERAVSPDVHPDRLSLILLLDRKWVNGTVLHYYFFDRDTDGKFVLLPNGNREFRPWKTPKSAEMDVVRKAFKVWEDVGVGLSFKEVDAREEAEVRIGFMRGDGAWSFIGRDIIDLNLGPDERTMNFGWDLTRNSREIDTAVHEIGHTFGFPHEHQNPKAGIVWDEEAVYRALAGSPNFWDRSKTKRNIIDKINPDEVQGSEWDPNSIMHYPFERGLIKEPAQFRNGLIPAGGLSARDRTWAKTFYPTLAEQGDTELHPAESVHLSITPGQQRNFIVRPTATRNYNFSTFGDSDTVMVLFEDVNGELRYLKGDDDSGEDRNASFRVRLRSGRKYVLRIRLYYATIAGETAVMMW
jgi:astacin (peptidase family M12A)